MLSRGWALAAGMLDNAGCLEPRFVGWYPEGRHPDIASVAEICAEGLLGPASEIVVVDRGQLEDGLGPSRATEELADGADGAEAGCQPGVGVGRPDPQFDDRQPPYSEESPD
jgi:hypothetical protein